MKIILLSLILVSINPDQFEKVDQLLADRQYHDAFLLLEEIDPENEDPEAFRRKIEACIDGYLFSTGHYLFALKNLSPDEDIDELRAKEWCERDMQILNVKQRGPELMRAYPDNYKLKFAVANFYLSMQTDKGCAQCPVIDQEFMDNYENLFMDCYENNIYDYKSFYAIAISNHNKKNYKKAKEYYKKSIDLNPEYGLNYLNLAIISADEGKLDNAISYSKLAINKSRTDDLKARGNNYIALIYVEKEDNQKALEYFEMANNLVPGNTERLLNFLITSRKTGYPKEHQIRKQYFDSAPNNLNTYINLMFLYKQEISNLITFFKDQRDEYHSNTEALGFLSLMIAKSHLNLGNLDEASIEFEQAKNQLIKSWGSSQSVLKNIDDIISQLKTKNL
ncbi:tetratricopeptide repeat protein [Mangrovivirga cuniculi]|uniref:Uncharacterized protein n=1 Tax=Mangrovivirga cuniculi TaxID=2715131 RepID=A0A4D7JQE3_9BACT|nr:tetratricopeptide repeat protein [Mangrovivirga cuniculi]QCK15700.1 hypothetical protein DCC35_13580 [Mangrovivirga cuniculi]